MSAWPGWVNDLIRTLGVPDSVPVRFLLNEWAAEERSSCNNNPLRASQHADGSTDCRSLPNGKRAQNYPTHAKAIAATVAQLESGDYGTLLDALNTGNPFDVPDTQAVADDLTKWGAPGAADAYLLTVAGGEFAANPHPGGPPKINPAQALRGWADVQHAVSSEMPAALHASARLRAHALRELARARKVHR